MVHGSVVNASPDTLVKCVRVALLVSMGNQELRVNSVSHASVTEISM